MIYFLLLASSLCLDFALNLPVGSLPLALEQEGATHEQIAMAMASGMFCSLIASMPVGALVDRIGRLATMRWAILFGALSMVALSFTHGPLMGGVLMACRNLALLGYMTSVFAYGSAIVPKDRSVSATATMGIVGNFCFASAPAFAVYLWQHGCGREQYLWADALVALGVLLMLRLPETHDLKISARSKRRIMMRKTWLPAIVFCICGSLQGGVNGALAVIAFHDRGIVNGATIFSAAAFTTVLLRYPSGRWVEIFGARMVAIPTAVSFAIGCVIASFANTFWLVVAAGAFLGAAWSAIVPVGLALLFEQSSPRTRGAAMGVYNFSLGGGAAVGASIATVVTMLGGGYAQSILICAAAPILSLPVVLSSHRRRSTIVVENELIDGGDDKSENRQPENQCSAR